MVHLTAGLYREPPNTVLLAATRGGETSYSFRCLYVFEFPQLMHGRRFITVVPCDSLSGPRQTIGPGPGIDQLFKSPA